MLLKFTPNGFIVQNIQNKNPVFPMVYETCGALQQVENKFGKDEVTSSNLVISSKKALELQRF